MNHLTLEQCVKLKEIGFPQHGSYFYSTEFQVTSEGEYHYGRQIRGEFNGTATYCCPVLEELIGWLGHEFKSLNKTLILESFNKEPGEEWLAVSNKSSAYGITPLEAVYNLAIAIKS